MRGAVVHGPGDVRIESLDAPSIVGPTDAVIEVAAACIYGSNLWPYRGLKPSDGRLMGHEYVGIVTEVGDAVKNMEVGDFVVGSFCPSDNTYEICRSGYQSRCVNGGFVQGAQAQYTRTPLTDGTLVVVPGGRPRDEATLASLLAASGVLGTGWFGTVVADTSLGETITIVSSGAVGLMVVLATKQLGAERIVATSRCEDRAALAQEFDATDVVAECDDTGVAAAKEPAGGLGVHGVIEATGTQESIMQAIGVCRPDGHVEYVDVSHDVSLPSQELLFTKVNLLDGPAPMCRFLLDLVGRILKGKVDPGKVFNLVLPLDGATEGYKAMDGKRTVKMLLQP